MGSQGTRRLERRGASAAGFEAFARESQASLVVLAGRDAGEEFPIREPVTCIGRGPEVDLAFPDDTLSQRHATLEFVGGGFQVRDLGSTNGTLVNEAPAAAAELKSGDRIQVGQQVLQLVIEPRRREPRVHVLPDA